MNLYLPFAREEVICESVLSPADCVRVLSADLESLPLSNIVTGVFGSVRKDRIVLVYRRANVRNSFAPIFFGRVAFVSGKSQIIGRFRMRLFVLLFLAVWFGGLLGMPIFAITRRMQLHRSDALDFSWLPTYFGIALAMACFAVLLVFVGNMIGRKDEQMIRHFIGSRLRDATA